MFPIPILTLLLDTGGVVPIEPGSIKKMMVFTPNNQSDHPDESMFILLNNGALYTQGGNTRGECVTGDQLSVLGHWHLAAEGVDDAILTGGAIFAKLTAGGWQCAGSIAKMTNEGSAVQTSWGPIPTAVTNIIDFDLVDEIAGTNNGFLYLMDNGNLYASGSNSDGALGTGSVTSVNFPVLVDSNVKTLRAVNSTTSILDYGGFVKATGYVSYYDSTLPLPTREFTNIDLATKIGEPLIVQEWMTNYGGTRTDNSVFIAGDSEVATEFNLYGRGISTAANVFGKNNTLPAFTSYKVVPGQHNNNFFFIDGKLYAWGSVKQSTALGQSNPTTAVFNPTEVPYLPGMTAWDPAKLSRIETMRRVGTPGNLMATFYLYDGNLYYGGDTGDLLKETDLYATSFGVVGLDPITEFKIRDTGVYLVGDGFDVDYTTTPENQQYVDPVISTTAPDVVVISQNPGQIGFVSEGEFTVTVNAEDFDGNALSATISGTAATPTITPAAVPSLNVGDIFLRENWNIVVGPPELAAKPELYSIEYFSQNTSVATIDTEGNITAVGPGTATIVLTLLSGAVSAQASPTVTVVGDPATSVTTGSIGTAIVGTTKQLTWGIEPANADVKSMAFVSSHPEFCTVDTNGLMTFVAEGGFDITMTVTSSDDSTVSDTSGGYASTLSVTTDSIPAKVVGDTYVFMLKTSEDYNPDDPGIVGIEIAPSGAEDLEGLIPEFTTTDETVVRVTPENFLECVAEGDCRTGVKLTYQGVVASDDSYTEVSAAAEDVKPLPYDGTDWEIEAGPGWLYLNTGLSTIAYTVDWGDGTTATHTASGGVLRHEYTGTGPWTCKVTVPEANLKATQHCITGTAVRGVTKWPTKVVTGVAFSVSGGGCVNLSYVPETIPATWTNISDMFNGCTSFNQDISGWDTTNITDMSNMFTATVAFNQPIGSWNVSNVTTMAEMFYNATGFNQPLATWDTSKVKNMQSMFYGTAIFNQPIGNWNVSALTDMRTMFYNNKVFTQDISAWKPTKVTSSYRQNWDYGTSTAWTSDKKPTFA